MQLFSSFSDEKPEKCAAKARGGAVAFGRFAFKSRQPRSLAPLSLSKGKISTVVSPFQLPRSFSLLFKPTPEREMDLQDVYSAWAADTSGMMMMSSNGNGSIGGSNGGSNGPLKIRTSAATGAAPAALGPLDATGAGGGAFTRTSSGFALTVDCSAGGGVAPHAPPAPPVPAAAATTTDNNATAAAAAPFCLLPGTAAAAGNGNRSPESEATRLAIKNSEYHHHQQHLMLPAVAVRAPPPPPTTTTTTSSSPEASSSSAAAAAAAVAVAPAVAAAPPPSISYDFATVYALLGSLFDPACAGIDHAAALAQLPRGEREVAGVWLRSVASHLRDPAAMAGHAAALTEAVLMDRAAAAAAAEAGMQQPRQQQ